MRAILLSNVVLHWLTLPRSYLAVKTWVHRFAVKVPLGKYRRKYILALYPGLLTPAFVDCSTIAGKARKGLVKHAMCSDIPEHRVDVWHSFCATLGRLSDPEKRHQNCPDIDRSVTS